MIAEWASAAVRQAGGTIDLGVRATGLELDAAGLRVAAVTTDDGRRIEAREVVLAVDAPAARELLGAGGPGLRGAAAGRAGRRRSPRPSPCGRRSTRGG